MTATRIHLTLNAVFWASMYLFWLGFNQPAMPNFTVNVFFTLVDFLCFSAIAVFTSYVLIPHYLYRKKYVKFGITCCLTLVLLTTIMVICNHLILKQNSDHPLDFSYLLNIRDVAGSYLLAFFLSSVTCIFKLVDDQYTNQSAIDKLRQDKIKTELEFLKMQINPHSFFNILNTIYFQIDLDKDAAKNFVLQFSEMFRYQLYECEGEMVSINKEIDFLKNFVDISKARFDSDYNIEFTVDRDGDPQVPPFLLFPLIENSFKHVSQHINKQNFIRIRIKYDQKQIECAVCNTTENLSEREGGIGLRNLKRRLDLIYQGNYVLNIRMEDGVYHTHLNLSL